MNLEICQPSSKRCVVWWEHLIIKGGGSVKRNKSYLKRYLCSVFALALILCSTTAFADIIDVAGDQPTIQAGIDAASDGDTVLVANGNYTGAGNKDLDFNGKAITVRSESGPENCIIDCERDGRGFYFHSGEGEDSVVSGFTITNGHKGGGAGFGGYGGGIYCKSSSPTISNCIITRNSVERGWMGGGYGGGIHCESSSATINNCTISNNTADDFGGGIHCNSYSVIITNCTINDNTADFGGGIYCLAPSIANCTIRWNTANHCGGGIYCLHSSSIANCTVTRNRADRGGGVYCYSSSPTITNCTIAGNAASHLYGGGGIYCAYSFPTITNCILWRDAAGEIYVWGGNTPTVTYCDVEEGYTGTGNIDDDPSFVDPENGDFHLQTNSSCIDAGTNDAPELPGTDKDGKPRIVDGDGNGIAVVDIGAYEFCELCEGDFDGDGDVDGSDLTIFASDFGRTDCVDDCEGDFDSDGDVDGSDLAVFAADFGRTDCPG